MTVQITNCPQPDSPWRERAYTTDQLAAMNNASPNQHPLPVGHWRDQPASARVGTAQTPADGNT